ncbi:uncharacterized protein PG986_014151 [Apiospora aurea]|uniref:Uncharacterized protein n=1 Tax=Apiospora aurea TaxID=335848 RepID=A0ABR1PSI0_9PEZI
MGDASSTGHEDVPNDRRHLIGLHNHAPIQNPSPDLVAHRRLPHELAQRPPHGRNLHPALPPLAPLPRPGLGPYARERQVDARARVAVPGRARHELDKGRVVPVDQVDGPDGEDALVDGGVGVRHARQDGVEVGLQHGRGRGRGQPLQRVGAVQLPHVEVQVDEALAREPADRLGRALGRRQGDVQHVGAQDVRVAGRGVVVAEGLGEEGVRVVGRQVDEAVVQGARQRQARVVGGALEDVARHRCREREEVERVLPAHAVQQVGRVEGPLGLVGAADDEAAEPVVERVVAALRLDGRHDLGPDPVEEEVEHGLAVAAHASGPPGADAGIEPELPHRPRRHVPVAQLDRQRLHAPPRLVGEPGARLGAVRPQPDLLVQALLAGAPLPQLLDHVHAAASGGEQDGPHDRRGAYAARGPGHVEVHAVGLPRVQDVVDHGHGRFVADGVVQQRDTFVLAPRVGLLPLHLILGVHPVKGEPIIVEDGRVGVAEEELVEGRDVRVQDHQDLGRDAPQPLVHRHRLARKRRDGLLLRRGSGDPPGPAPHKILAGISNRLRLASGEEAKHVAPRIGHLGFRGRLLELARRDGELREQGLELAIGYGCRLHGVLRHRPLVVFTGDRASDRARASQGLVKGGVVTHDAG